MKYHFFKKIYDVINKVCTFKFENLTFFLLHSHCRQWKREPTSTFFNLIWRLNEPSDLSFYCTVRCDTQKCTSMQNLKTFYVCVIYVFLTLNYFEMSGCPNAEGSRVPMRKLLSEQSLSPAAKHSRPLSQS